MHPRARRAFATPPRAPPYPPPPSPRNGAHLGIYAGLLHVRRAGSGARSARARAPGLAEGSARALHAHARALRPRARASFGSAAAMRSEARLGARRAAAVAVGRPRALRAHADVGGGHDGGPLLHGEAPLSSPKRLNQIRVSVLQI